MTAATRAAGGFQGGFGSTLSTNRTNRHYHGHLSRAKTAAHKPVTRNGIICASYGMSSILFQPTLCTHFGPLVQDLYNRSTSDSREGRMANRCCVGHNNCHLSHRFCVEMCAEALTYLQDMWVSLVPQIRER